MPFGPGFPPLDRSEALRSQRAADGRLCLQLRPLGGEGCDLDPLTNRRVGVCVCVWL